MEYPENGEYACSKCGLTTPDQGAGARHANASTGHLVARQDKPRHAATSDPNDVVTGATT